MAARLIDGKAVAEQINAETAAAIVRLKAERNITPGLAVVLVGDNPASRAYVNSKDKMCARLGMHSVRITLPATTTQAQLLSRINDLNFDRTIHGILVQAPLPAQISEEVIFAAIDPSKDVDFAAVQAKASLLTPVPGGVGPMTIALLMHNSLRAAIQR